MCICSNCFDKNEQYLPLEIANSSRGFPIIKVQALAKMRMKTKVGVKRNDKLEKRSAAKDFN